MNRPDQPSKVKTRILILSDTHGQDLPELLGTKADVAIHCGDMTNESKLAEYETSLRLLRGINAPLKLVIGGNHDFTLHKPAFERILADSRRSSEEYITEDDIEREYGTPGQATALFTKTTQESATSGVILLDEGSHTFELANGAQLIVFASPFTPSKSASMGFQYVPSPGSSSRAATDSGPLYSDGHIWAIPKDTHIVMTHGPPRGLLDRSHDSTRTGSDALFAAVAEARPHLHCFGHIHEAWGARLVTWRGAGYRSNQEDGALPSHFTHIDNERSRTVESLSSLTPGRFDSADVLKEKQDRLEKYRGMGACVASFSKEDEDPLRVGEQTLFVNAAIEGTLRLPWVIDIDLPRSC
jgi:Icc-related predicted phosphoesterase